jgi:hypothetical protein
VKQIKGWATISGEDEHHILIIFSAVYALSATQIHITGSFAKAKAVLFTLFPLEPY